MILSDVDEQYELVRLIITCKALLPLPSSDLLKSLSHDPSFRKCLWLEEIQSFQTFKSVWRGNSLLSGHSSQRLKFTKQVNQLSAMFWLSFPLFPRSEYL